MKLTFKQYLLTEGAQRRAVVRRVADAINTATNSKFNAKVGTRMGSEIAVLEIITKDGKIPAEVYDVLKTKRIGTGDKQLVKNPDGTITIKMFVEEI